MRITRPLLLSLALLAAACGKSSPTSSTPTPAAPTKTEQFTGTLGVGASAFYSFTSAAFGTLNITLSSLTGADGAVSMGLSLGTPAGFGCPPGVDVTVPPGDTAQITGAYDAGVYCVRVYDAGNLTAPSTFNVAIAHP